MRHTLAIVADDGRGLSCQPSPKILARSVALRLGVNDLDFAWENEQGQGIPAEELYERRPILPRLVAVDSRDFRTLPTFFRLRLVTHRGP
jgi:hypothetical protein